VKAVILLAGKGRRLGSITRDLHKSLICLDEFSLLHHLIENCIYAGITDFIPIVGHNSNQVLSCFDNKFSEKINVYPVKNEQYNETNNLFSLCCARDLLEGSEFLLCNGDIVIDREIVRRINDNSDLSKIAVDDFEYVNPVDSPGILMNDDKITDLGRHIPIDNNEGYAIGVYKFNKALSERFFKDANLMLDKNINAGFHDPLPALFNEFDVYKSPTNGRLWTDIDSEEDIAKAKLIHANICEKYRSNGN
jgi:choline kinase